MVQAIRRPTYWLSVLVVLPHLWSCDSGSPPAPVSGESPELELIEVARERGLDFRHDRGATGEYLLHETMGGGMAWLDADGDGDLDLFLPQGQPVDESRKFPRAGLHRLFLQEEGRFVDRTLASGLGGSGYGLGATVADVDNDGDADLYVIRMGPNALYLNDGAGKFREAIGAGVEGSAPFSGSAAFGDVDGDGLVDLFLTQYVEGALVDPPRCQRPSGEGMATHPMYCGPISFSGVRDQLFRNLGNGKFEDITDRAGLVEGGPGSSKSLGVVMLDLDGDDDLDIYVACDTTANHLYLNDGDGRFREEGLLAGVAASGGGRYEGGMGLAAGDVDGDGRPDLHVTNYTDETNRLYRALPGGLYEDASLVLGVVQGTRSRVGWGTGWVDLDLDGYEDLYVACGHIHPEIDRWEPGQQYRQRNLVFLAGVREGTLRYREVGERAGAALSLRGSFRGGVDVDFDDDGDRDLCFLPLDGSLALLENRTPRGGRSFLQVRLVGEGPGGRDAIGARVELVASDRSRVRWRVGGGSYLSQGDPRLHFGLPAGVTARQVRVRWPGGEDEVFDVPRLDVTMVIRKGEGKSAPHSGSSR